MPNVSQDGLVVTPEAARRFVAARVSEGVDYIKMAAEAPGPGGPDQATLNELVVAAHENGKKTVTHATSVGAMVMALESGTDILTHVPMAAALTAEIAGWAAVAGRFGLPTLTMMEGRIFHTPLVICRRASRHFGLSQIAMVGHGTCHGSYR
jgi:hypothetical protein